jgi:hypothetical protein
VIVDDEVTRDEYAAGFPTQHGDPVEVLPVTLDGFRRHALPGSGTEWNAYTFAHITLLIDKLGGEIGTLTVEKGRRDPAKLRC